MDYRGLNNITVKKKYILLPISAAFELLQDATILSKLDLCNTQSLVMTGREMSG